MKTVNILNVNGVGMEHKMTVTDKSKLDKKFYDKVVKLAIDWAEIKQEFDSKVENTWGYHYSDSDIDEIIDSIDYGHGDLEYNRFRELMGEPI